MVKPGEISGRRACDWRRARHWARDCTGSCVRRCAGGLVSRSLNDLEQLALASEGYVFPCAADVSQDAEVDGAFAQVPEPARSGNDSCGGGGVARFGNTLDLTHEDWHEQIATNLTGMFLTDAAALKDMVESGGDM